MEHCWVIKYENIVEVGFLREYGRNRIDNDEGFFYEFYAAAIIIKNLPTPYKLGTEDDPFMPIKMRLINGTGLQKMDTLEERVDGPPIISTNFYIEDIEPANLQEIGAQFTETLYNGEVVKVVDTYFVPEVNMFPGSYFEVTFPPEIVLPKEDFMFAEATTLEMETNTTEIPCAAIQGIDSPSLTCMRVMEFVRLYNITEYDDPDWELNPNSLLPRSDP